MSAIRIPLPWRSIVAATTALVLSAAWSGQASALGVFIDDPAVPPTSSYSGSGSDSYSESSGTSSTTVTGNDGVPHTTSDSYFWSSDNGMSTFDSWSTSGLGMATMPDALDSPDQDPCLRVQNHEYEVCTAYKFNSVAAVLAPYYRYVHGTNSAMRRYVEYRLGSRYVGDAQTMLQSRVSGWPAGNLHVSYDVDINGVNSDLSANRATLRTRETWRVTTDSGRVVYSEQNQPHTVTMERVPSYILHKWVVTNIQ